MPGKARSGARIVKATHGFRKVERDPDFELGLSKFLSRDLKSPALTDLYRRFAGGEDMFSVLMRRAIFRVLARNCGDGLVIGSQVGFKHLDTFSFGSGVFIGAGAYLQGRVDGKCTIGNRVWIGHRRISTRALW